MSQQDGHDGSIVEIELISKCSVASYNRPAGLTEVDNSSDFTRINQQGSGLEKKFLKQTGCSSLHSQTRTASIYSNSKSSVFESYVIVTTPRCWKSSQTLYSYLPSLTEMSVKAEVKTVSAMPLVTPVQI